MKLVAQKALTAQPAKRFVSEQFFGGDGIEAGNSKPPSVGVPDSSASKAVELRVRVDEIFKGLRHGDEFGSSVFVIDGLRHQLVNGHIGEPSEVGRSSRWRMKHGRSILGGVNPEDPVHRNRDPNLSDAGRKAVTSLFERSFGAKR